MLRLSITVLLVLTVELFNRERYAAGEGLQSVHSQSALTARLLRSFEVDGKITHSDGRITHISYLRSGDRFRTERRDTGELRVGDEVIPPQTLAAAFDGDKYQRFDANTGEMYYHGSGSGPRVGASLVLTPYYWLTHGMDVSSSWSALKDASLWERRFENASYVGRKQWGEFDCHVIQFPHVNSRPAEAVFRVFFAHEYGMYPVRHQRVFLANDEVAAECTVKEMKRFQEDGLIGIVPLTIAFRQYPAAGTPLDWELVAETDSLRINHEIPRDAFRIVPQRADAVYDQIANPVVVPSTSEMQERSDSVTFVLLNVVVCILLLAAVLYHRRHRFSRSLGWLGFAGQSRCLD